MTAIIDVYIRKIVDCKISNTMSAQWCKKVLEEAIRTHGKPEIVNSDQGSQYTAALWIEYLEHGIRISMDGKGRALDNIWNERFRKTLKFDYIYLHPVDDDFFNSMVEFKSTSTITMLKHIILQSKHRIKEIKNPLKKQTK